MPVNLSIKEVPDELAAQLRSRAARNHRSLQRELMAIVEAAVAAPEAAVAAGVHAAAPAAPAYVAWVDAARPASELATGSTTLLAELDAIVAGSRWGQAPLLTRDQANDRRLLRELEFDARRAEAGAGA